MSDDDSANLWEFEARRKIHTHTQVLHYKAKLLLKKEMMKNPTKKKKSER